jgi:hypothetical protein
MVKDGLDSRDTRDVCPVLHSLAFSFKLVEVEGLISNN